MGSLNMGINLSAWAIRHQALIRYFIVVLMLAGVFSYQKLGQLENPEFTIKTMIVKAMWQGASAREVEQQLTDKLEKKLQETPWLDHIRSYSKPGESTLFIQLKDHTPPDAVPDVWYQVRKKVADIKHTLPQGVNSVIFDDEFGDTYGAVYAFTADGFNYAELKNYVDAVRQELLRIDNVSKVNLIGVQDQRIYIELSHVKLASLNLSPQQLITSLSEQNTITPAGVIHTETDDVYLRISGDFDSVENIRNISISINGTIFHLSDIAHVYRGYVDPASFSMRFMQQDAIGLAVSMQKGGDVLVLGEHLTQSMKRIKQDLPLGIEIHQVSDQPEVVKASIKEFLKVLMEAVAIVLVVSFLSLGMRTGLVVALSIPLVLAITFCFMLLFDIDLQRISLGALIIALGLLVDDAMIAVEMMASKLEQGWDRMAAATFAYTSTAFPMLSGTLITAAAFLPVGIAKSAAGEYVFSLFSVVIIALLVSWVVAVVFIPYLGYILLPEHKKTETEKENNEAEHDIYQRGFYPLFRRMVTFCIRYRKTIISLTVIIFAVSVYSFRFVEQQFFPSSARPELLLDLQLPQGASYQATLNEVKKMEGFLKQNSDVKNFVAYVGGGSPRFYLAMDIKLQNKNFAQFVVMSQDKVARERIITELNTLLLEEFPAVRGRVSRLENGPPVGYPVKFRVTGKEIDKVREISHDVAKIMRENPFTRNVHLDWNEKIKTLRLNIDQNKARALGLSSQALSQTLHNTLSGVTITQYREEDELIAVVGRITAEERQNLSTLEAVNIHIGEGKYIPLGQIAHSEFVFEEGIIWRRNRFPTITVNADIVDGIQAPDVTLQINPQLAALRAALPLGYEIQIGGAFEESKKSEKPIGDVMPLMLLVIVTLLMLQLQSVQRTIIVLLTAPLGLIGLTLFLLLLARPFGFVAMLGAISLAGMIMRNSVILVDQIEQDIAVGCSPWEAIIESTVRRVRPIVLTAAAAILAMIPLSQSVFWGPMAIAIMGGLLVATLFTLFFLPALYAAWFRITPPQQ